MAYLRILLTDIHSDLKFRTEQNARIQTLKTENTKLEAQLREIVSLYMISYYRMNYMIYNLHARSLPNRSNFSNN